jgi:hypothetical protein
VRLASLLLVLGPGAEAGLEVGRVRRRVMSLKKKKARKINCARKGIIEVEDRLL